MQVDFSTIDKKYILLLPILPILLGVALLGLMPDPNTGTALGVNMVENVQKYSETKSGLETLKQELETLKIEKQQREEEKKRLEASNIFEKVIYENKGLSFGTDASFTPLFEIIIGHAKTAGIKIRSIDYNYSPTGDTIFDAKLTGYNTCELNIVAVGSYSQFQNFYKSVYSEPYLTNFAEIEIEPWDINQSVLITKLKLRLYTKT